jgi:hypothetical protein
MTLSNSSTPGLGGFTPSVCLFTGRAGSKSRNNYTRVTLNYFDLDITRASVWKANKITLLRRIIITSTRSGHGIYGRLTRIIIADTTPEGINNAFNKLIRKLTIIADLFTPRRKPGVGKGCP